LGKSSYLLRLHFGRYLDKVGRFFRKTSGNTGKKSSVIAAMYLPTYEFRSYVERNCNFTFFILHARIMAHVTHILNTRIMAHVTHILNTRIMAHVRHILHTRIMAHVTHILHTRIMTRVTHILSSFVYIPDMTLFT
jgi:hypothetical protein